MYSHKKNNHIVLKLQITVCIAAKYAYIKGALAVLPVQLPFPKLESSMDIIKFCYAIINSYCCCRRAAGMSDCLFKVQYIYIYRIRSRRVKHLSLLEAGLGMRV